MNIYRVAFVGHRAIKDPYRLEALLDGIITEMLHSKEYVELCICGDGDFDILASVSAKMVQRAEGKQNSRLVLIQHCRTDNDAFHERFYDEVRYPVDSAIDAETAIAKRNQWVIDHIDMLVAYVEPDRHDSAWATLKYAEEKCLKIINLATS